MGRILVPIDPSRMGYQRQTGDYQSNYQSPFEGILPHVLVNTAIPLAGKLAGAGMQRYADYSGKQDLATKQAEHEGMNPALYGRLPQPGAPAPAPAPAAPDVGGERMGPAAMERSPRAAAAGALAMPVQKGDLLSEFNYNTPANQEAPLLPDGSGLVHSRAAVLESQAALDAQREGAYRYPANVEDYRGYRGTMDWPVPTQPVETPFGPAVGPRTGVPITEAMVDEEGNPIQLAGIGKAVRRGATAVNSAANRFAAARPKTARAAAAAAVAGGAALGVPLARSIGGPASDARPTPGAPTGASGVAVGLPPSGPGAPPPVAPPPPPDTTGTASATGPAGGPASTAPGVRNYGVPGGRRVDESRAVAALGDLTPDAAEVDIPPPAAVAGAPATAAAQDGTAAAAQPKPPRQLLRPGIHDYQTLMNAAAIAQTPEEKQQVIAAAERSGLVDAPSESWLDVINPGARTARGFAQLRGVLGDAGGKTDPLLAIKAENYQSQIRHRQDLEDQAKRYDAKIAADTQRAQAQAAEAASQERAKTEKAALENEEKRRRIAYLIPQLTAKLGESRARAIIAAQDAMDRGEMNDAAMQFKRALAGRNNAETTKIFNMLPHWMRESIAKASYYDRYQPPASAQVTFGERRQAGTEDDLIKGHRTNRTRAKAFSAALDVLNKRGDKAALDYVVKDAGTFGRLADEIGKGNLTADALRERLEREVAAEKTKMLDLETEIKDRGGTINANGTVTFPLVSR